MSGSVVPIKPGPAVQISGSNVTDTTLYNMSTTGAIWVGNSPSVSPNNGMRIGPLGTAHWAKDAGLAYACVDTGILTTINLNISNDISNPANPVDVATATATQLLAQGVPNVLVQSTLLNTTLVANVGQSMDVSGQASITITASTAGTTQQVVLQCFFYDPVSGQSDLAFYLTVPANTFSTKGEWVIPVTNSSFNIVAPTGSPSTAVVIRGSNRPVPSIRQIGTTPVPRQLGLFAIFAAGTPVTFTANDGIGDPLTRYNGPVELHVQCANPVSANAAGFFINAAYAGLSSVGAGNLISATITPTVTNTTMFAWNHPSVPVLWTLYPNFNTGTAALVFLSVIPAGNGF